MDIMWLLWTPLILITLAAGLTAVYGLLNGSSRIPFTRWSQFITLAPAISFGFVLLWGSSILDGSPLQWQAVWIPSLNLSLTLYVDGLSVLFGVLITGIGTLIVLYTSYYFSGDNDAWRFLAYLMLFMAAMLGVVMAGDIFTLFICWELTSITSFLLVAYKYKYPEARAGAFRALLITGGGGVALLAGLIFMSFVGGTTVIPELLLLGDTLRVDPLYPVMFFLIFFGAATKSAQVPAHIWLPGAMSAPTPASAYLHSATMVKAGIYILARLNPALGATDLWFWSLTIIGLTSLLVGAYVGLKQDDLKGLLAYSTISQLGALVMLVGQNTEIAFKALVIGILAHALYKSSLFLIVGTVDHSVGSRDLRKLGGLQKLMPGSFMVTAVATLSMAGLPPLFGFLAKETLLATAVESTAPGLVAGLFNFVVPAILVVSGAFILVQAGMVTVDTFMGSPRTDHEHHFHAPHMMMWFVPAVPAFISLAFGILPEPYVVAKMLALAAEAVYGAPVKVSMALWTGINIPLMLSIIAVASGTALFYVRHRFREWLRTGDWFQTNRLYEDTLRGLDGAAYLATRLQFGSLRFYLGVMVLGMVSLVVLTGGLAPLRQFTFPSMAGMWADLPAELLVLRLMALLLTATTAIMAARSDRDFPAIIALGVSGLGVAIIMILEPAPDVALVQVVVDILAVVILVLALMRLPRRQRVTAKRLNNAAPTWQTGAALFTAVTSGGVMAMLSWVALSTRPDRVSQMTPFYEENAKSAVNAADFVGAIVVDFRALDTLIEIAVFGLAGLAVYILLRHATQKWGDDESARQQMEPADTRRIALSTQGVGGAPTSTLLQLGARLLLSLSVILAITHVLYGHDQPGDGFTAGVIVTLGLGFWFVVFGYESSESSQLNRKLQPGILLGGGLGLGLLTAITTGILTGNVFGHMQYFPMTAFLWPTGFALSSSLLFEISIALTVVGSGLYMINTLARPYISDHEDPIEEPREALKK